MQMNPCKTLVLLLVCLSIASGEAIGGESGQPVLCAGVVVDGQGKPVGGANVKQCRMEVGPLDASPIDVRLMRERVTGDDGRFDFGSAPRSPKRKCCGWSSPTSRACRSAGRTGARTATRTSRSR